jgi:branched-chain amino acid transport system permease protein
MANKTILIWLVALIVLAVLPLFVSASYILHILILAMVYSVLASSWNLVAGYTGIFSFAHHAFFGIGAYASALMVLNLGMNPWLGLIAGGVVATMFALLIGLPVLRIKSLPHMAIVTLGFGEIVRIVTSNLTEFTRGELGLFGIKSLPSFVLPWIGKLNFAPSNKIAYYYTALVLMALVTGVIYLIIHGRMGLAFKAIRDNQDAARALGISVTRYTLTSFCIGAFMAGMTGSFYAHYTRILTPSSVMDMTVMVEILAKTLIGGFGTFLGPIIGSFGITILLESLRDLGSYRLIVYGLALIAVILFFPKGLASFTGRSKPAKGEQEDQVAGSQA